ncbi:MAG: sulfite exporter TauE/SafE family protein [Verrucomicrobiota bacterium]
MTSPSPIKRRSIYPVALALLIVVWVVLMQVGNRWGLFEEKWAAAVTMVGGSFVAGSTPAGGGAVAFPVFTKGLKIESEVSRTFCLLIQTVGMGMATLFILSRGMPVAWRAIRLGLVGGIPGLLLGLIWLPAPEPLPRLLFTVVMAVFGVTMIISHWVIRWSPCPHTAELDPKRTGIWQLAVLGFVGGYVASQVGSGIDLLLFMGLTLAFGLHERHAIPTSVVTMAIISGLGSFTLVIRDDPTVAAALPYWWVSVPVVACGAPLGAWVVSHAPRDAIVIALLCLITLEVTSTTLIVGWQGDGAILGVGVAVAAALYFGWMLRHRDASVNGERSGNEF